MVDEQRDSMDDRHEYEEDKCIAQLNDAFR